MDVQTAQSIERSVLNGESFTWDAVSRSGPAVTVKRDGLVLACCGLVEQWYGRAVAWSLLSSHCTASDMLWLTREIRNFLNEVQQDAKYRRVEAVVHEPFTAGHRWVHMLGFKVEGVMPCYTPCGETYVQYGRVVESR